MISVGNVRAEHVWLTARGEYLWPLPVLINYSSPGVCLRNQLPEEAGAHATSPLNNFLVRLRLGVRRWLRFERIDVGLAQELHLLVDFF